MLTKRQQQVLMTFQSVGNDSDSLLGAAFRSTTPGKVWHIPCTQAEWAIQLPTTTERAVRILLDCGLIGFEYKTHDHYAHLTPTGERLATILAELPAPLTRRQWQILLRFRDVGSDSSLCSTASFRGSFSLGCWYLPEDPSDFTADDKGALFSERTCRILCDYGLLGFEYRYDHGPYAHLTPLGEELVSLLP